MRVRRPNCRDSLRFEAERSKIVRAPCSRNYTLRNSLVHNKVARIVFAALLGAAILGGNERTNAAERTFSAGAATADLTPQTGVSLDGPISKPGPARGVHDPLTARALVLKLGETCILIVVNDMCLIDRDVYDEAKRIVEQQTGIPIQNQLMSATHSHATPRVVRISTRQPDEAYRRFVAQRIAKAAAVAYHRLAPAKIGFGTFNIPELVASRRFLCDVGSVEANPFGETGERVKSVAGRSRAIIGPAGPTDAECSILSVRHADGQPLAVLANFSVHYCGGYAPGQVSADYFGYYARRLTEKLDHGESDHHPFVGIMSNGTSGDIGTFQGTPRQAAWIRMEHFGKLLADETVVLLEDLEHHVPTTLAVASSELELAVRKPNADRVAWARRLLAEPAGNEVHRWSRVYAQETLHLADYPERYSLQLQAIRVGEIGIAAAPCEIFAETGLAIKKSSPFEHTFTVELSNGYSGYLPTPQQHDWGGYETWPARSSHLEREAEPKIRDKLLRLLREVGNR